MALLLWFKENGDSFEYKSFTSEFHRYRSAGLSDKTCVPICFYPDKLFREVDLTGDSDNKQEQHTLMAVSKQDFENHCGNIKEWELLTAMHCLTVTKTGFIEYDGEIRLNKFDGMTIDDLTEIEGITEQIATDVYEDLIKTGTIIEIGPSQVMLHEQFRGITLQRHRHFETEVLNVFMKCFSYRLALREALNNEITLPVDPELQLYGDFLDENLIQPDMIAPKYTSEDEILNGLRLLLSDDSSAITGKAKVMLKKPLIELGRMREEKYIPYIAKQLCNTVSGLTKLDTVDSKYQELQECGILKEDVQRIQTELDMFHANALGEVIILKEKRWSLSCFGKIGLIATLGVCQIAAGIVLEVITSGVSTPVSATLIGEGVGDLMYAVKSLISGYCSLKDYFKYKVASVITSAVTVVTFGIGAFISRGAKFAQYGYKLGRQITENFVKKQLWKAVIKRAGIRLLKSTGNTVANFCLIKKVKAVIEKLFKKVIKSINRDSVYSDIERSTEHICKRNGGVKQVKDMLMKLYNASQLGLVDKIRELIAPLIDSITTKLSKFGGELVNSIATALQEIKFVNTIISFTTGALSNLAKLKDALHSLCSDSYEHLTERVDSEVKAFCEGMVKKLKEQVSATLNKEKDKMLKKIVKTAAEKMLTKGVSKGVTVCTKLNNKFREAYIARSVRQERNQRNEPTAYSITNQSRKKYCETLLKLAAKTRKVDKFCDILREDIPGGIIYTKAVAEYTGHPVKLIPNDPTTYASHTCFPSPVRHWEAINIRYEIINEWPGYQFEVDTRSFDCFIEACASAQESSILKEDVIELFKTNKNLRRCIEKEYYGRIIEQGGKLLQRGRQFGGFLKSIWLLLISTIQSLISIATL